MTCWSSFGCGTIFKITPTGELTTLHIFELTDGAGPIGGLVLGTDGMFYGTTFRGGSDSGGTVFRISRTGAFTTLHIFTISDGDTPYGPLIEASDGNFYGTTSAGGNTGCSAPYGCGTVFKITPGGNLTTLHMFDFSDGASPFAALIEGSHGNFYGTAWSGGANSYGTVFKITAAGTLTTLHDFCVSKNCPDGANPGAPVVQGSDGALYGVATQGRSGACQDGCGTLFRATRQGAFSILHVFKNSDGAYPLAGLIQATDSNLYGATAEAGLYTRGTLFDFAPERLFTTLYNFCQSEFCPDGSFPSGTLLQFTDGRFYGSTAYGGSSNVGTVFTVDMGLGPFVAFVRGYGRVGRTFGILGQGFTGTTSVLLNGIPASFSVVSDTYIRATVPVGATTGFVTVITPSGTLTSNVPFHVLR
jgi:uncharacterized repeat protein (TIGR03803 family)